MVYRDLVPVHALEMRKHIDEWIARRQIFVDRLRAIELPGVLVLAEYDEAGRVVDLCIDDQNCTDPRVSDRTPWL